MICHKHRVIFIHLPKCGGTSIEIALTGKSWHQAGLHHEQHLTAKETRDLYGEDVFQSYFKFTVVRNTWDLLVAYYLWGTVGLNGQAASGLRGKLTRWLGLTREWGHPFRQGGRRRSWQPTFPQYLRQIETLNPRLNFSRSGQDLTQQVETISIDGHIAVDHVGRFEDLPNEFRRICERAGLPPMHLPHRLKSNRRWHYSQYYSPELRDLVSRQYPADITGFGFSFEECPGKRRWPLVGAQQSTRIGANAGLMLRHGRRSASASC